MISVIILFIVRKKKVLLKRIKLNFDSVKR